MARDAYAFGDDSIDGEPCPAVAGDFDPQQNDHVLSVAEEYDSIMVERYGISEGTVPASVAESVWSDAIDSLARRSERYYHDDPRHSEYLSMAAEKGREIASVVF